MKKKRINYTILSVILLIAVVLIALFATGFVRGSVGDVLVVLLIFSLLRIPFTNKPRFLALYVFLFAVLVEISQYFDFVSLIGMSGSRLVSTALGGTFSIGDIACYGAGAILSALTQKEINSEKNDGSLKRLGTNISLKAKGVECTYRKNALHMLKSVINTICDSFIITTADGKVIVIDGGYSAETGYFIEYLRAATGSRRPHIDAWFITHAHDDHAEVFLNVIEKHRRIIDVEKVYVNLPPVDFYRETDSFAHNILHRYEDLKPLFEDKEVILHEGDTFNIGDAKITVLYTFDPSFVNCNESSLVFRMDLGEKSIMFTGDCEPGACAKILKEYADSGILKCDICKMSHHGQNGCEKEFYEAVSPEICLWPTPSWLWTNLGGKGPYNTLKTREWIKEIGVKKNYVSCKGTKVIMLGEQNAEQNNKGEIE